MVLIPSCSFTFSPFLPFSFSNFLHGFFCSFYEIYDIISDSMFYFYLQCILCYCLNSIIVESKITLIMCPEDQSEKFRSSICRIVFMHHVSADLNGVKPSQALSQHTLVVTMNFISIKCLVSPFEHILDPSAGKLWKRGKLWFLVNWLWGNSLETVLVKLLKFPKF